MTKETDSLDPEPNTLVIQQKTEHKTMPSDRTHTDCNRPSLGDTDLQTNSTSDESYPVSDLVSATTNQFTHAYRQASDYVRNYAIDEENDLDACNLQ